MTKLFFIHLMKTGGASFRALLRTVHPDDAVYPGPPDGEAVEANLSIERLRHLDDRRRSGIAAYAGHFPYVATTLVGEPVWTATLVREPVSRTISLLKHCRRYNPQHRGMSLEDVYDDEFLRATQIRDYQTKMFAMDVDDRLESQLDVIDVDERRLAAACANLDRVEVVGRHDRYDDFVSAVARRTGWTFGHAGRWRTGEADDVDPALRERIAADNTMDLRFYRYACELVDARGPE